MGIHLFVLGKKGLNVAKAALDERFVHMIEHVIVGKDREVDNDYSTEIEELCARAGVGHHSRSDFKNLKVPAHDAIAIAVGWRWLIHEPYADIVVFHDSLLPRYRGFNPLVSALLNRDEFVGATVLLGNKEFDRGDILLAEKVPVEYPVKIGEMIDRVADCYASLAEELLKTLAQGEKLSGTSQDESDATYSVWRDHDDYRIDWNQGAEDIAHFVNCVGSPYLGASTLIDRKEVRVLAATAVDDVTVENRHPGKMLFVKNGKPVVICGSGLLRLDEVVDDTGRNVLPLPRFRIRFH